MRSLKAFGRIQDRKWNRCSWLRLLMRAGQVSTEITRSRSQCSIRRKSCQYGKDLGRGGRRAEFRKILAVSIQVEWKDEGWCERGDSNPHGFPRQILSLCRNLRYPNVYAASN